MFKFNDFYQDDKVNYVGSKLAKRIGNREGWVVGSIKNEHGMYVVEFEGDSYIIPAADLVKAKMKKDAGPEIRQFRKRSSEDE